jgi:LysM repeat protein
MLIPTAVIGGETDSGVNGLPPTWTPIPSGSGASTTPADTAAETPAAPAPPAGDQETYTVQAGDTLAEIAARFGVTIQALVQANNIENVDYIEVGQVLVIPR